MQFNNPPQQKTKMKSKNMTTLPIGNSISRSPLRPGLLFIPLALCCFMLAPAPKAFGVSPPPDGGYPNGNTAEGQNALFSLTSGANNTATGGVSLYHNTTGIDNTANGYQALYGNTTGSNNTANGFEALFSNTTGSFNTATGNGALVYTTTGSNNTANGRSALFHNTTGGLNTANGSLALYSNTTGGPNTANGSQALYRNTTGNYNTANGVDALYSNTTGGSNTANGLFALFSNTTGGFNTANGADALSSNTTGPSNTATGYQALNSNTTGGNNTASGFQALLNNTGFANTANGSYALYSNTIGQQNTASGFEALDSNVTGNNNTAIGTSAGSNLTTGSNNIDIGNFGVAAESDTIRIGSNGTQNRVFITGIVGATTVGSTVPVLIDGNDQLGTMSSSRRFKKEIKPMDSTSEAILALKPVTFHYKSDKTGTSQFGLIAEEVAEVNPDLIVRDKEGEVYTVRYDAVNAMLLNEFLKEHGRVQEQATTIAQLKSTVAQQQKGMEVLAATLNEQASQIQKVSDRLELSKPAPKMAGNDR
jgi:trimeric autotransporter adhesin